MMNDKIEVGAADAAIIEAPGVPFKLRDALHALHDIHADDGHWGDALDAGAEQIENAFAAMDLARELVELCDTNLRAEVLRFDGYLRDKIADMEKLDLAALRASADAAQSAGDES